MKTGIEIYYHRPQVHVTWNRVNMNHPLVVIVVTLTLWAAFIWACLKFAGVL